MGESETVTATAEARSPSRSPDERQGTIRVLVVDDLELFRTGVRHVVGETEDLRMAGEARTMRGALRVAGRSRTDVAVVDLSLAGGEAIALCRRLHEQGVRCLVLTSVAADGGLLGALVAGADGFLPKEATGDELTGAIRILAAGGSLLDGSSARALIRHVREGQKDPRFAILTPQERLVLALLGEGLTNQQIAERAGLAEKTVRNYVSRVLAKLGFQHRTEAALYATRHVWPADG